MGLSPSLHVFALSGIGQLLVLVPPCLLSTSGTTDSSPQPRAFGIILWALFCPYFSQCAEARTLPKALLSFGKAVRFYRPFPTITPALHGVPESS